MLVRLHRDDPKVERLQRVPGFERCSTEELSAVVRLAEESRLAPGAVLTRQGYVGRECFLILRGTATVTVDGVQVATVGPGDFVGEMGLLGSIPRTATVRADSLMEVFVVGPQAFRELLEIRPVVRQMLGAMSARLAAVHNAG